MAPRRASKLAGDYIAFDDDKNFARAHALRTGEVDSAMELEALVSLMGLGVCALLLIAFWGLTSR
ncbi:hypothetical protein ABIB82_002847 [Bradyrhizobium sp. i1.8.4]